VTKGGGVCKGGGPGGIAVKGRKKGGKPKEKGSQSLVAENMIALGDCMKTRSVPGKTHFQKVEQKTCPNFNVRKKGETMGGRKVRRGG